MANKKQQDKTLNKKMVTTAESYMKEVHIYLSNGQRKEVKSALIRALMGYRSEIKTELAKKIESASPVQIMNDEKGVLRTFVQKDHILDLLTEL